MFFPAREPAEADCRELRHLRLSMNAPVLVLELLPLGPASAAIAVHPGPPERPRVSIALRARRSGELALYTGSEALSELGSPVLALDAALSFAESMGFLFDECEVEARGDGGPAEGARLWRAFLAGEDASASAPPARAAAAPAEPTSELLLEEVADAEPPDPPEPPSLTKFRRTASARGPADRARWSA